MKLSDFPVYGVSQVNQYIKTLMDGDGLLSGLLVRGEISNYKRYPSGHHYFSLKDDKGAIRCVMFRGDAARLRFQPGNGMSVIAFGRITVFPRDGQYQLYCSELFAAGQGDLNAAFEQLKKKLSEEGLFDPAAKKPLPAFPGKIALITSGAGAAVRDMIRVLGARWPMARVLVVPVRVQGEGAAEEIAAAIHAVNNRADIDLIITGRGGGSREDLWAFNEEIVARAIYISNIPVISAVGHEPDVTIADYVADLRAATPSNGAELAVPDQEEWKARLEALSRRMDRLLLGRVENAREKLRRLCASRALQDAMFPIEERRLELDRLREGLCRSGERMVSERRGELSRLCAGLDAMSPLKVLSRGYAIPEQGGQVVYGVEQVKKDDVLTLQMADGRLSCRVLEKEHIKWQKRK